MVVVVVVVAHKSISFNLKKKTLTLMHSIRAIKKYRSNHFVYLQNLVYFLIWVSWVGVLEQRKFIEAVLVYLHVVASLIFTRVWYEIKVYTCVWCSLHSLMVQKEPQTTYSTYVCRIYTPHSTVLQLSFCCCKLQETLMIYTGDSYINV